MKQIKVFRWTGSITTGWNRSAKDSYETWMRKNPKVKVIDVRYDHSFWDGDTYTVVYDDNPLSNNVGKCR